LIPTRGGNGALDELEIAGDFSPPRLATLEAAVEYGLNRKRGRVFADLWDTKQLKACPVCREERIVRLGWMNLHQAIPEARACEVCGGETEL
jgi:archaeosine synthase beta-subunit